MHHAASISLRGTSRSHTVLRHDPWSKSSASEHFAFPTDAWRLMHTSWCCATTTPLLLSNPNHAQSHKLLGAERSLANTVFCCLVLIVKVKEKRKRKNARGGTHFPASAWRRLVTSAWRLASCRPACRSRLQSREGWVDWPDCLRGRHTHQHGSLRRPVVHHVESP